MANRAAPQNLAAEARRIYAEHVVHGLPGVAQSLTAAARGLVDKPAEYALRQRRRELAQALMEGADAWQGAVADGLRHALLHGVATTRAGAISRAAAGARMASLSLVDNDTIEREILTSRLAMAIMDRVSWEFADLRSRMAALERRGELEPHDMLRAQVLAQIAVDAWCNGGLVLDAWRDLQAVLHEEFAALVEEAYHEVNRWLMSQGVMPEMDLRPFIKRARSSPVDRSRVGEETRMMTRTSPLPGGGESAEAVLGRLNRLVARHLPGFASTTPAQPLSERLQHAISEAQEGIRQRVTRAGPEGGAGGAEVIVTTPTLLQELHQRKQQLKAAAATPEERATIEIVALLFQSILTEDRIPPAVRVWFARLQMPVLRVAVTEPDFFATVDHPARRLIDRMGACVMGFDSSMLNVGEALEKEIKRVVQVVEAYPDTGRRVFQTVLTEFEKFLEHYLRNRNEATRKAVSLAQQVEQRETLAIQYTIELRKMLNEVPVQEGVRQFLFHVWADVLATTSVRFGTSSPQTKAMKRAAADLIWSASAKVTREERAEVLRRLPPLLKGLREGMTAAGIEGAQQDEQIQHLNNSLAAAFTAKAALIPHERLSELMEQLETLEELLPDTEDVTIDESILREIAGQDGGDVEVISEGGSMASPAMVAWARELQVGTWYMLEVRGRSEALQLAWHGVRKQLSLFVSSQGRCILFQQQRLAGYLQAGLLLPAEDEALTVRATRNALAKLDLEPSRLLN